MRRFYTSIAALVVTLCASAATLQSLSTATPVKGLSHGNPALETGRVTSRLSDAAVSRDANSVRRAPIAKAPEESTDWTSIGKGIYLEDLLTIYSDVDANQTWEVDIETSESNPGWYRFLPYASGPIAELLGEGDTDNYLYINASDPNKVYGLDFEAFGAFAFSNYVPESEWGDEADGYGVLADGVITFETQTWITYSNNWIFTTRNTGMKIYLPGSDFKDYSLKLESSMWCGPENIIEYNIKAGADVAEIKAAVIAGEYPMSSGNASVVAADGESIVRGNLTVEAYEHGIHSLLVVALDNAGNIQSSEVSYFFGNFEDDNDWKVIGTGKFSEGIYATNYNDIENETFDVEVQESKTTAGRYRLANPYANHSILGSMTFTCEDHGHYIYIDATQPDRVFIEPSAIGVDGPYGQAAINSYGAKYAGTESENDAKEAGFYGTFNPETRTIDYPDDMIFLGERGYENGKFLDGNTGTSIVLPPSTSGVSNVIADSDVNAPVEFFNLQGQRIDAPAAGQLVIRRQGSKVNKVIM